MSRRHSSRELTGGESGVTSRTGKVASLTPSGSKGPRSRNTLGETTKRAGSGKVTPRGKKKVNK